MANTNGNNATMTAEQELAALRAENAQLRKQIETRSVLSLKVGPSGGVSLSGINAARPVTLYAEQWERLFGFQDNIRAFIAANDGLLDRKSDDDETKLRKLNARDAAGIKRPEVAAAEYAERQRKAEEQRNGAVTTRQATPAEMASLNGDAASMTAAAAH